MNRRVRSPRSKSPASVALASALRPAAFALLAAGCGPGGSANPADMAPKPNALAVCSPTLASTATPSFQGDVAACAEATTSIAHHDAADIVPDGYVALGAASLFDGASGPFNHGVDLVLPCDPSKGPEGAPSSRFVVVGKRADGVTAVIPASNIVFEPAWNRLHFHVTELATYQAAVAKTAGAKVTRHFSYRAIGGVSMGGIGSSMNFWRNPDRYDAIAVMGADPGPDLTYTLGFVRDLFFSGFCDAKGDNGGALGSLCPTTRQLLTSQGEEYEDFEHLNYQAGNGVGLTLNRRTYVRAFRDLSRALGNPGYARVPASTGPHAHYLPPGVEASTLWLDNATACSQPTVLSGFFDWQFNPDAKYPVITFCDGGDSAAKGLGVFDGSLPQTDPTQILLAVDVNGNGRRDSGEPVLMQGAEHFYDYGTDGLPDAMEPGYDAKTNPDPNHDDYDYYWNPTGTENNWRYDKGEKYDDCGLDGVCGKGCAVGTRAGCYDFGEGNGQFDLAPGAQNWYAHDPHSIIDGSNGVTAIADAQLARIDTYYDAGIRDFFNAEVSTNSLIGALGARGEHTRVWDGFPALDRLPFTQENSFNVTHLDFDDYGRHMYVRYGDPDLNEAAVDDSGDGRHVGTTQQAVYRAQMLFYFVNHVWPDGDTDVNVTSPSRTDGGDANHPLTFTATTADGTGRVTPYAVVVPPGYDDPGNAQKTYPVMYLMHGYGMKPEDLASVAIVATNAMVNSSVPASKRLQKMICVFVDAVCRPGGDISSGPLSQTGDICEEGTFYAEHADGTAQAESQLVELQTLIEKSYRTKPAADLDVVQ